MQIKRSPVWTYTSSATGYKLYKNGVPQGGASTLGTATRTADGRRKHWRNVRKDIAEHAETARRLCDINNAREDS